MRNGKMRLRGRADDDSVKPRGLECFTQCLIRGRLVASAYITQQFLIRVTRAHIAAACALKAAQVPFADAAPADDQNGSHATGALLSQITPAKPFPSGRALSPL